MMTNSRALPILLALAIAPLATAAQTPEKYEPVADPAAVVTAGHARFTVLTPQMIRMEWAADGKFEDHASLAFLNRRLPLPKFSATKSGGTVAIDTGALRLEYKGDAKFVASNLAVTVLMNGKGATWHPGVKDTGNLGGTTRTLDRAAGPVDLEPGLVSRDGWTVVDDSERPLFDSADFSELHGEQSTWPWLLERPAGERQDLYFFGYGHDYRQALSDFTKVAGKIPMPPRFAFGVWWSRYWPYSDEDLQKLVDGYRQRTLPLDVLVIDMDWHLTFPGAGKDQSGHPKGWSGYTWNPNLFPDPDTFLGNVKEQGLKVTLNLHPASGVQPFEKAYPAMARAMGQDPKEEKYVPFNITDKKFAQNYFDILHHPMEKQGVDFWWLDWQQEMKTAVAGVNPTFWLNYTHFSDQEREGKRPLLFHRWGGLGNHRYQIGFSGDTVVGWPALQWQPEFTATAANVGYAYWSHDIGGHMPGPVGPEMYTRWIQWGEFAPILRTHTSRNNDAERRVWAYPEPYDDAMEHALRERERWIPYLYTESRRTYDTGVAFLHPLYYDWPEAAEAYSAKDEYMFGDKLLVAPVVAAMDPVTRLATEDVWLPEGQWVEASSGKHFKGPVAVKRSFGIDEVPVYMRPGAIVPKQPVMAYSGAKPVDPLTLAIAPLGDGEQSSYTMYEDSGKAREYESDRETRWTPIHASRSGATLTVKVDAAKGTYPGAATAHKLVLELPADWPPQSVTVNGKPVEWIARMPYDRPGWHFEGDTLTTVVMTAELPVAQATTFVIKRDPAWVAKEAELDGFAEKIARLRVALNDTANQWPVDALIRASETGARIGYHPATALQEVEALPALLQVAQKQFTEIAGKAPRGTKKDVATPTEAEAKKAKDDADRIARTQAMLAAAIQP